MDYQNHSGMPIKFRIYIGYLKYASMNYVQQMDS